MTDLPHHIDELGLKIMQKYRTLNENKPKLSFKVIDKLGNMVSSSGHYYMNECPSCGVQNLPHAIASGRCYRCDYTLDYKDEKQTS